MRFDVITLFPERFVQMTGFGVTGAAIEDGKISVVAWNPRDYSLDRHRRVDDRPYGGGPGMVMQVEPLQRTLQAIETANAGGGRLIHLSPQGRRLDQVAVRKWAAAPQLTLLCGRYEGIDERFVERYVSDEVSIGDYVLSGGELAAAVMIDAMARLQEGVLGHVDSAAQDSFVDGLLDCPHYTRPEHILGMPVPEVLLSGDHAAVARWRRKQALGRTWQRRSDLLENRELDAGDRELLAEFRAEDKS